MIFSFGSPKYAVLKYPPQTIVPWPPLAPVKKSFSLTIPEINPWPSPCSGLFVILISWSFCIKLLVEVLIIFFDPYFPLFKKIETNL